jgi:hypothetical protein
MTVSKYLKSNFTANQQRLAEDLVVESIKIAGVEVQYLPRNAVDRDNFLGEAPLSKFDLAVPIEVYMNNVQNFEGEGDLLSKFGLEIRDSITLTMARRRWEQIRSEKLTTENDYTYQIETANTLAYGSVDNIMLEAGSANGYSITSSRPREGDLIFIPFINNGNGAIYEVKFVEHEKVFYQFGKLYTYELKCELFRYSSERIDTGNTQIDSIENRYSVDSMVYQFQMEDGDFIVIEDDDDSADVSGYLTLEEYGIDTQALGANNTLIIRNSIDYIDFSESNPFSEVDRW